MSSLDEEEREYVTWLKGMTAKTLPQLKESGIFLALLDESFVKDSVPVLQFGLAVLLGKPIYLAIPESMPVNENIQRLARGIYRYTGPEDALEAMKKAVVQATNDGFVSSKEAS